jgi:hypothetical protein
MKTIEYIKLVTKANTQYIQISQADFKYVVNKLREVSDFYQLICQAKVETTRFRLVKPNKSLPRKGAQGGYGYNTIVGASQDLLDNLTNGTQRDLSIKTANLFECISEEMNEIIGSDWEKVKFEPVANFSKTYYNNNTANFNLLFDI